MSIKLSRKQKRQLRKENLLGKENIVSVHEKKKYGITLNSVIPKTLNQEIAFSNFEDEKHLLLHGMAGTGKTFISLYLAFREIFTNYSEYDSVTIIRSAVPTRDIGFLPGKESEKTEVFEQPYKAICEEMFGRGDAYQILKTRDNLRFVTTSYVRGMTFRDSVIIIDECQNLSFHELDSIVTRIGNNCRVIFCGDFRQSDLKSREEKNGLHNFMQIIKRLDNFKFIEFDEEDILRSDIVRDYIIAREQLGLTAA